MKLNLFVKNTGKILLFSTLIIAGCKKKDDKKEETVTPTPTEEAQPSASFTSSKTEYVAGDTIVLTSSSTNAGSLRWTLPDGTTETTNSIRFSTNTYTSTPVELNLPFRLDAISPSGKKTDYSVKNIKVNRLIKGSLVMWMPRPNNIGISGMLSMDGKSQGTVMIYAGIQMPLGCNQAGYTTMTFPVGAHEFVFTYSENGNTTTSTKSTTITENGCAFINF